MSTAERLCSFVLSVRVRELYPEIALSKASRVKALGSFPFQGAGAPGRAGELQGPAHSGAVLGPDHYPARGRVGNGVHGGEIRRGGRSVYDSVDERGPAHPRAVALPLQGARDGPGGSLGG